VVTGGPGLLGHRLGPVPLAIRSLGEHARDTDHHG
jgi:hypothetical protein